MKFSLTLEIELLLHHYSRTVRGLKGARYDAAVADRKKIIVESYAKAIELSVGSHHCLVMPIDMAIDYVTNEHINDGDGRGYLLDICGEKVGDMDFSIPSLQKAKKDGVCFIAWHSGEEE